VVVVAVVVDPGLVRMVVVVVVVVVKAVKLHIQLHIHYQEVQPRL
jgi:hypothetical protein